MTYRSGEIVEHDGKRWKVIGVGFTREDGRTYYRLVSADPASMIRQKNGSRPRMVGVWL